MEVLSERRREQRSHLRRGHVFRRGLWAAVCEKTFHIMMREPYAGQFEPVLPLNPVDPVERRPFDCARKAPRHPRETKGMEYDVTTEAEGPVCADGSCC